jgi:hypothetical protein
MDFCSDGGRANPARSRPFPHISRLSLTSASEFLLTYGKLQLEVVEDD